MPLVIAGAVDGDGVAARLAEVVARSSPGVHFETDEYGRDIELTDAGIEHVEAGSAAATCIGATTSTLLTELNCALHAAPCSAATSTTSCATAASSSSTSSPAAWPTDRHWPDGLQAALEAKEGLERRPDGRILGSITMQQFLRGYPRLCGMTGTAQDCGRGAARRCTASTWWSSRPTARGARSIGDLVFTHREAKERAVVAEIRRAHATRRPVLVGTATVAESERLAARLRSAGVPCEVLNARNDARRGADRRAGGRRLGAVTISTNMAGRGTDIRLGGARAERERGRVAAAGGLYVVGTNRHESRRVDLQLRGRAGRQGDPGESRFFVSLEDPLLVRYGVERSHPGALACRRRTPPSRPRRAARDRARAAHHRGPGPRHPPHAGATPPPSRSSGVSSTIAGRRSCAAARSPGRLGGGGAPRGARGGGGGGGRAPGRDGGHALPHRPAWREHLSFVADLREGIHLVRLGGEDPLHRFTSEAIRAFAQIDDAIDAAVRAALDKVRAAGGALDLSDAGLKAPTSTWTYLVNDDPFRNRMAAMLTGPGGVTLAIYSALMMMPLLIAWGLVETLFRRVTGRRADPYGK